jgi:hypothetical protein
MQTWLAADIGAPGAQIELDHDVLVKAAIKRLFEKSGLNGDRTMLLVKEATAEYDGKQRYISIKLEGEGEEYEKASQLIGLLSVAPSN